MAKNPRKPKAPTTRKKPVIRSFFIEDSTTDKVFIKSTDKKVVVSLQLTAEGGRKRKLGVITKSTKTMEMKRKRSEHLFWSGNAYGFNQYVIQEAKLFDKIRLSDEHDNWVVPVKAILEQGRHLNFKQRGYELQLFLTLEQLSQFKVTEQENRRL